MLTAAPVVVGAAAAPIEWQADLAHCRAQFMVSHMVVSQVWGHIPVRQLTIVNTGRTAVPQRIDALLDVSHEDTDNHIRDADLRSPTYFDVGKYPTMTFHSTSIVAKDANEFTVTWNPYDQECDKARDVSGSRLSASFLREMVRASAIPAS